MENKNFYWKDVKLTIMGEEIDIKPIEYNPDSMSMEFEGTINITRDELESLMPIPALKKEHKLTNYQRKKQWKKFCKIFNIEL